MVDVFTYQGVDWSSKLPSSPISQDIPRQAFQQQLIAAEVKKLAVPTEGEQPIYIATGGGYGSNNSLLAFEKGLGSIPSIKGDMFRDNEHFTKEKSAVTEEIKAHFGFSDEDMLDAAKKNLVNQTLRTFYSDEVNTKIGKEVVKSAIASGKSVAYESASLSPDTIERTQLAHEQNPPVKTVLIAGDMDLDAALDKQANATNKFNTAASYKLFAARFLPDRIDETLKQFDEIRIYNTDGAEPVLIAEKKGAGQKLEIKDPALFDKFTAKQNIDLEPFVADPAFASNSTSKELWGMVKEQFHLPSLPAVETGPPVTPPGATPAVPKTKSGPTPP